MLFRSNLLTESARIQSRSDYHTDEHILVCLSSSPSNARIIRTAARMARAFRGNFTALFVETKAAAQMGEEDKKRLRENMHLAEQLGASVETTYGEDVPYQIAEFARLSGVSKIVIGRSTTARKGIFGKQQRNGGFPSPCLQSKEGNVLPLYNRGYRCQYCYPYMLSLLFGLHVLLISSTISSSETESDIFENLLEDVLLKLLINESNDVLGNQLPNTFSWNFAITSTGISQNSCTFEQNTLMSALEYDLLQASCS